MRERSASRGVSREGVAAQRQKTLDLLAGWYSNGWEWWGVECCFDALGEEFVASCYGIDDYGYANDYMRHEIAEEVVAQLEAAGYTVTGQPEPEKAFSARRVATVVSSKQ